MSQEIRIAVAKVNKYAVRESGDTLEIIERPSGGISVVLADGQRSGKSAKKISTKVVRKVVSLLADGVRDGAAARAASDYLFNERQGKVSATLNIVSIDLASKTIVVTRNNPSPVYISYPDRMVVLDKESTSVGTRRSTRPVITHLDIENDMTILAFTDGVVHAGTRYGTPMDVQAVFGHLIELGLPTKGVADAILSAAVKLDQGRPSDDISVFVLRVLEHFGDNARRMTVRVPIGP